MSTQPKRPLSEARLAANRANAQKSTGPKTPEGKLRSAANACQHGFAGTHFAVVRLEDPAEIDHFKLIFYSMIAEVVHFQEVAILKTA